VLRCNYVPCILNNSCQKNRVRNAMKLEDLIHEYLSHRGCCKRVLKGLEMSIPGKAINNHHDDGFISRFG
jgi:hypothetical protein